MITLAIYDQEIELAKRAFIEIRDAERQQAKNLGPLHRAYEPALRNADRAHEIFERLLYTNRVGCRAADAEIAACRSPAVHTWSHVLASGELLGRSRR